MGYEMGWVIFKKGLLVVFFFRFVVCVNDFKNDFFWCYMFLFVVE